MAFPQTWQQMRSLLCLQKSVSNVDYAPPPPVVFLSPPFCCCWFFDEHADLMNGQLILTCVCGLLRYCFLFFLPCMHCLIVLLLQARPIKWNAAPPECAQLSTAPLTTPITPNLRTKRRAVIAASRESEPVVWSRRQSDSFIVPTLSSSFCLAISLRELLSQWDQAGWVPCFYVAGGVCMPGMLPAGWEFLVVARGGLCMSPVRANRRIRLKCFASCSEGSHRASVTVRLVVIFDKNFPSGHSRARVYYKANIAEPWNVVHWFVFGVFQGYGFFCGGGLHVTGENFGNFLEIFSLEKRTAC